MNANDLHHLYLQQVKTICTQQIFLDLRVCFEMGDLGAPIVQHPNAAPPPLVVLTAHPSPPDQNGSKRTLLTHPGTGRHNTLLSVVMPIRHIDQVRGHDLSLQTSIFIDV